MTRSGCLRAYDIVLDAEPHAGERAKANLSNQEAKDNIVFTRLAGYLLGLFNQRAVLTERALVHHS